ncbi:MAG: DNA replication and repair protein RecF [Cyclobacteriaceae bacterium]
MYLKNLELIQFKNYQHSKLDFSEEVNCFFGDNGAGKTNLLDAIHYICLTKSAFNSVDQLQIKHDHHFFTLKGEVWVQGKSLNVNCVFEAGKKKRMELNGKWYTKLSDHIGLFPIVMIAPDDTVIITGGSEERRKFFDNMMCQTDKTYLHRLIRYQHFLKQRNALLKKFSEGKSLDKNQIEPYNCELINLSKTIFKARDTFCNNFQPLFSSHYKAISGAKEQVSIQYKSDVQSPEFEMEFSLSLEKDLQNKRTGKGIHKDDFLFDLEGYPIKKFGSQGQKKSFLISLKLAQFFIFKEIKQTKPVLLMDDIFDKLDESRIGHLMERVAKKEFGQLFITDARPERSRKILSDIPAHTSFFMISNGSIQRE